MPYRENRTAKDIVSSPNTPMNFNSQTATAQPMKTNLISAAATFLLVLLSGAAIAASCPFDTPGTTLTREGLVLSRYANGFTGNALVANSGFAATDASTIQSNIVALTDQLDLNRNGSFDTTDATIISRKIAGFSNAAATAGIPAANLGPGGTSAVNSFLLSGCGNNAFVQGGNAFGAPAVLGTTDGQPLGIVSADNVNVVASSTSLLIGTPVAPRGGLTIFEPTTGSPVTSISGAWTNAAPHAGAVIAGGGRDTSDCTDFDTLQPGASCSHEITGEFGVISGGIGNVAGSEAAVGGGGRNRALGNGSFIGGGLRNFANGTRSVVAGGDRNLAVGIESAIAGGAENVASGDQSAVAGGERNASTGSNSAVLGGVFNVASGNAAAVVGGASNMASGDFSVAAGRAASASDARSFVWGGSDTNATSSSGIGTFTAYAPGGFFFFRGAPGAGGCTLPAGTVSWSCTSDRNTKTNITSLNARDILKRVANIPITRWSYKGTESVANIGPMAQDFWREFKLGDSDKSIASMNMSGVALAAIQGLNQKLSEQVKAKDREIAALKARLNAIEKKLLATR
jgi:hypothetical protein